MSTTNPMSTTTPWKGTVVAIQISNQGGGPMQLLEAVNAVAGQGLENDRYFQRTGSYSKKHGPDREVTLIEIEAIEGLAREYGITMDPAGSRRNIVTRGVPLNHLVGQEFQVGDGIRLRGIRLCEPCDHMAKLAGKGPKVREGLVHRGGLRAQILAGGTIRVGDTVEP